MANLDSDSTKSRITSQVRRQQKAAISGSHTPMISFLNFHNTNLAVGITFPLNSISRRMSYQLRIKTLKSTLAYSMNPEMQERTGL